MNDDHANHHHVHSEGDYANYRLLPSTRVDLGQGSPNR